MERKKLAIACAIVTLVAVAVVVVVMLAMRPQSATPAPGTTVTVKGMLACLPHKNAVPGQPQTLECAIGLYADDGRYYSLVELPPSAASTDFTTKVQVSGELTSPDIQSNYDTVGTITVKSFSTN